MRRDTIVGNLKNRLKRITAANGYTWEPKVFEWLVTPLGDSDFPAIVIKDANDDVDSQSSSGSSEHNLKVEIMLFVKEGAATPSSLRSKMQDILAVIGEDPQDGEDMGEYISFDGSELLIEQQHEVEGGVKIDITVSYMTEKWSI